MSLLLLVPLSWEAFTGRILARHGHWESFNAPYAKAGWLLEFVLALGLCYQGIKGYIQDSWPPD